MALFTPGQFRQSLQNKIKEVPDPIAPSAVPVVIKNNRHESFTKQASSYAASEMRQINSSVQAPRSTANLPAGSFINKSVRERMQTMVQERGAK